MDSTTFIITLHQLSKMDGEVLISKSDAAQLQVQIKKKITNKNIY
jgi:hypothetical protein